MGTITPILDTLLPQVLGRAGDAERIGSRFLNSPLSGVLAVKPSSASGSRPNSPLQDAAGQRNANPDKIEGAQARTRALAANESESNAARSLSSLSQELHLASARLQFSPAGKTIAMLLKASAGLPQAVTQSQTALLQPGQLAPASIVTALGAQVALSGGFYEAHLMQWLQGKRTIQQLMKEPQAMLAKQNTAGQTRTAVNTPGGAGTQGRVSAHTGNQVAGAVHGSQNAPSHAPVDERLMPLLRQQLDIHDTGVFRWRGEAWPGAPMDWEIAEYEGAPSQVEGERSYTTSMRLDMPKLGALEVRLTLENKNVQVHAWAETAEGVTAIDSDKNSLRERLERSGFDRAVVDLVTEALS